MRFPVLGVFIAVCAAAGALPSGVSKAHSQNLAQEEIIFIAPSRGGSQIRAVPPDGRGGREIFAIPDYATQGAVIWEVSASPDGERVAFSSDHDWDRSYNHMNVYVIDADGSNLRRPSDAPSVPQLAQYETGMVQVEARRLVGGGELSAWVQGAREPARALLREGQSARFTVEAADFGPDIPQYARVLNHNPGYSNACSYAPAVRVDVEPGQTVDAGSMPMLFSHTCPRAFSPGWISNDTLALVYAEANQSVSPHNIWTVNIDIQPNEAGTRWFDTSRESVSNRITRVFAGEAEGDEPTIVALRNGALYTSIHAAPASDPASMVGGATKICGTLTCKVTSVDATPDGRVTIISAYATDTYGSDFSAIYISRDDGPFVLVLKLENEAIGTAAISPDGTQIVFDRARRLIDSAQRVRFGERPHCPCSIWRVGSDGQGLERIVEDGRAPDWAR